VSRKQILTETDIEAGSERVWEVLADLEAYPGWNPMIRRASGELVPGERLQLHFEPEGQRGRNFRPRLLVVEPGRELRWLGSPGFPGFFESEHYFLLEDSGGGRTHLAHGMDVWGLLVPFMAGWAERTSRAPFEDMNRALKARVEGVERG
jgi:hypothetical protein